MAIIPSAIYPAQVDSDGAYPLGKARNSGSHQDGTGTPLEKRWVNDLWGFQQALLAAARLTASGTPDEVGASQYLDAVRAVAAEATLARDLYRSMQLRTLSLDGSTPSTDEGMAVISVGLKALLVKGGTNGVFKAGDTPIVEMDGVSPGALANIQAIAHNGTSRYLAVGDSGCVFSASGSSWTLGGALTGINSGTGHSVVWDGTRFIVADSAGNVAHSTDGVAWTAATTDIAAAVGGSGTAFGLAVLEPGTVLSVNGDEVAVSTDHGATWSLAGTIPTALSDPSSWIVGNGGGEVYAFVKQGGFVGGTLVECWASSDGVTWEKRSEVDGFTDVPVNPMRAWMCQDSGLLAVGTDGVGVMLSASGDRGFTWSPLVNYTHEVQTAGVGLARGRIFASGNTIRIFATDPLV